MIARVLIYLYCQIFIGLEAKSWTLLIGSFPKLHALIVLDRTASALINIRGLTEELSCDERLGALVWYQFPPSSGSPQKESMAAPRLSSGNSPQPLTHSWLSTNKTTSPWTLMERLTQGHIWTFCIPPPVGRFESVWPFGSPVHCCASQGWSGCSPVFAVRREKEKRGGGGWGEKSKH